MSLPLNEIVTKADLVPLLQRLDKLEKENRFLRKGLAEYVGTNEACRLTGVHRDTLYDLRQRGEVEYKYEGRKVLYLRTSLEAYNASNTPRRRRSLSNSN